MEETILKYFINEQSPWALLFVVLFYFTIKTAKDREDQHNEQIKVLSEDISKQIKEIDRKTEKMVSIWEIMIKNELDKRKKKGLK